MTREFFELLVLFVGAFALVGIVLDAVIGWVWERAEGYLARRCARQYLAAVHRDRTWRHADRP